MTLTLSTSIALPCIAGAEAAAAILDAEEYEDDEEDEGAEAMDADEDEDDEVEMGEGHSEGAEGGGTSIQSADPLAQDRAMNPGMGVESRKVSKAMLKKAKKEKRRQLRESGDSTAMMAEDDGEAYNFAQDF